MITHLTFRRKYFLDLAHKLRFKLHCTNLQLTIDKKFKMFKSMLFFLFYSYCFAQPVEKIVDQDDTILPGAELMNLSFSSSQDGNNVEEILKQLSAVLTYDLHQTQSIMADMKAIKTEMVKMKDEFNDIKEKIVDNSNTISEVNMIAERNSNQVNQQEALTMNNMLRLNSMANKVVDIKRQDGKHEGDDCQ